MADKGENYWEAWTGGIITQISLFSGGNQIFILAETISLSTEAAHSQTLRSKQHLTVEDNTSDGEVEHWALTLWLVCLGQGLRLGVGRGATGRRKRE